MWIVFALLAAGSFTSIFLIFKHLHNLGLPLLPSLVWLFVVATLFYLAHAAFLRQSVRLGSGTVVLLLIGAGFLSYIGNIFQFRSVELAPNPGYAVAVVSSQALLISIASIFIFGSDFSVLKGIGVFLCVAGVGILSIG